MNMSPGIIEQLAYERRRDMMAQASRQRLVREARRAAASSRQAEPVQRRSGRLLRRARPVISPS